VDQHAPIGKLEKLGIRPGDWQGRRRVFERSVGMPDHGAVARQKLSRRRSTSRLRLCQRLVDGLKLLALFLSGVTNAVSIPLRGQAKRSTVHTTAMLQKLLFGVTVALSEQNQ